MQKQNLCAGGLFGAMFISDNGDPAINLVLTPFARKSHRVDLPRPEVSRDGEQMWVAEYRLER
jgi:hypothetical protein